MVAEAAVKKLYDAATTGDVATIQQVLLQDPYLLDVVSFAYSRNLLHIATMRGQLGIVEEVLRINPYLARDVDSKKSSPLHIAAAQGHSDIASMLLAVAPEMCRWLDDQGMNPVHIAAMNGRIEILRLLIETDCSPGLKRLHRGKTVLHLCVEHGRLEALTFLMEKLGELVYAKDDDGETLLHLAARSHQFQIIIALVVRTEVDIDARNANGHTALEIFDEFHLYAGGERGSVRTYLMRFPKISWPWDGDLTKMSDLTMVVVVLIATMAFQGAVSPPGGVWQDDTSSHRAGEAVMASTHPKLYKQFVRANTTAFISSLVTIFLNTTRFTSVESLFLRIAKYAMWLSLASIAVSYGASLIMTTPSAKKSIDHVVITIVAVYYGTYVLFSFWISMKRRYLSWKNGNDLREEEYLFADSPAGYLFYRIFVYFFDRAFGLQ